MLILRQLEICMKAGNGGAKVNTYCHGLLKPKLQRLPQSFPMGGFFPKENLKWCLKAVFHGRFLPQFIDRKMHFREGYLPLRQLNPLLELPCVCECLI